MFRLVPSFYFPKSPTLLTNSFSITPVQAIIFLAPLTFNLTLEEDPSVNRIEDSIIIWKAICSNRILERTTIILFLNKMDVLETALGSGLQVKQYVSSYGNLPNDVPSVAKCMSFSPCTKPVSQLALLQTSGINSRGIMYVCLYTQPRGFLFGVHRKGYRPNRDRSSGTKHQLLYVG